MPAISAQTTVTAPESPYNFAPLVMHVFPDNDFPITRFGARKGDVTANTEAFRKAMEACNKRGGGRVVVPAGEWLTGPIHFRSNCQLYLSEGATVVFEDDPKLYLPAVKTSWEGTECMNYSPLVYAYECENVGISGPGRLSPKMEFWRTWFDRPDSHVQATRQLYAMCSTGVPIEHRRMEEGEADMRPHLIQFNRCTNVQLDGFSIRESPFWTIHIYMSKDVWIHDLDVFAHGHNNDGVDLEMTQHALVENCLFDQGDDAVVIKAGRNQDAWRLNMPTQDIVVRNCKVAEGHCLLGIGSEMSGGVRRVYMHDCHSTTKVTRMLILKTNHRRGGFIEDITMENVSSNKAVESILDIDTDVLYQWRDIVPTFETKITRIRNIVVKNATCGETGRIYDIKGDARDPVDGVLLQNVHADTLTDYVNNAVNVKNLITEGITWDTSLFKDLKANGVAASKPLYRDPFNFGSTDPIIVRSRQDGKWYMFYTSRRATLKDGKGAEWVHGSSIGIANSSDLAHWYYQQDAQIDYKPDAEPTYWAPAIVDDGQLYHMYLTYVPGIFRDWNHPRRIVHLTSENLLNWEFRDVLNLMSDKVIDADVLRLKDGTWRMWYNQEPGGKLIAYADSKDLYNWEDHGLVEGIGNCEGPKAFFWKGSYWLVCDEWKGFSVYRSDDARTWTRQPGNILQTPGKGLYDDVAGNHCDVVLHNGHAYIYYFTHLSRESAELPNNADISPRSTFIQVAELKCDDGKTLTCDRDAETIIR